MWDCFNRGQTVRSTEREWEVRRAVNTFGAVGRLVGTVGYRDPGFGARVEGVIT